MELFEHWHIDCSRLNTVRLWLPQLFAIVEGYLTINKPLSGNSTICDMLASHVEPKHVLNETMILVNEPCIPVSMQH